jgi:O-antigen/teichoic acid export membrane protein
MPIKRLQKLLGKKGDKNLTELVRGGLFAFGYRVLTMIVSYALVIVISRKLGKEGIGIWNLCLATLNVWVMVGCFGFNTSVVRFVSEYRSKNWYQSVRTLYRKVSGYSVISGLFLGALLFFTAEFIAIHYFKDEALILPLKITAIIVPPVVISTINVEFIRGMKRIQISEFFRTLVLQATALIGTFIASVYSLTAEDPLISYALGAFLALLGTTVLLRRFLNEDEKKGAVPTKSEPSFSFKSHLIISLPMILTSFIQLLNGRVDILMLGYFSDTGVAGIFGIAFKLSIITNFVIGAMKAIAMPKISELFWSNKRDELKRIVQFSTLFIFAFAFPVSLVLILFPEFILSLIDQEFTEGASVLRIFALMQLINAGSGMVAVFLNMSGNQVFFTRIVAITTTMNIVLNLILIPEYGMEGAAIATLLSTVTWNIVGVRYIYKKYHIQTFFNPFSVFKMVRSKSQASDSNRAE